MIYGLEWWSVYGCQPYTFRHSRPYIILYIFYNPETSSEYFLFDKKKHSISIRNMEPPLNW